MRATQGGWPATAATSGWRVGRGAPDLVLAAYHHLAVEPRVAANLPMSQDLRPVADDGVAESEGIVAHLPASEDFRVVEDDPAPEHPPVPEDLGVAKHLGFVANPCAVVDARPSEDLQLP